MGSPTRATQSRVANATARRFTRLASRMVEAFIVFLACLPGAVIAQVGEQTPAGEPLVFIGIGLLFAALIAIGPLVRWSARRPRSQSPAFGLAEFPG